MIYSGFWRRFLALLIDGVFIWVICMITIIPWFISPVSILIAAYYHVVFEVSPLRATPGKALMKLAVVKSNGSKLTIKDSIIRFAVSFISSAIMLIGYLMALFTERRQTLHDIIADTVVIDETFAEHNFWQIFVEQSKIIFGTQGHPINADAQGDVNTTYTYYQEKPVTSQSLEELYNLHQKGILTDEEYKMKKEEYLKKL